MIESIAPEQQELDEVTGNVPSCYIQPPGQMRERKSLVDRTYVSYSISTVNHNTCQQTWIQEGRGGRGGGGDRMDDFNIKMKMCGYLSLVKQMVMVGIN